MRLVNFNQEVSGPTIQNLLVRLQSAEAPDGVFVDSPGGQFEMFSSLAPAIERRGIITVAGTVESAANILYLLGHTRYALADATFFFHEVRTIVYGERITICDLEYFLDFQEQIKSEDREEVEAWMRKIRMGQHWFQDFIARKTGTHPGVFANLMRDEATLTAYEAMDYGIVHRILREEPTLI